MPTEYGSVSYQRISRHAYLGAHTKNVRSALYVNFERLRQSKGRRRIDRIYTVVQREKGGVLVAREELCIMISYGSSRYPVTASKLIAKDVEI